MTTVPLLTPLLHACHDDEPLASHIQRALAADPVAAEHAYD